MTHKVSWDRGASYEDVVEAARRVFVRDGIPRHVYADGLIMKYNWVLSDESLSDNLEGETLEEHIAKMLAEVDENGKQG